MRKHRYYLVYRTYNLVTGDYYIGFHVCNRLDDGYLGSGLRLKASVNKYGRDAFKRRILKYCNSRQEMIFWEKKYIAKHLGRKHCLNIAEGGHGGWHHVNTVPTPHRHRPLAEEVKAKIGATNSIKQAGPGNSQFGKMWIAHDEARLTMRVRREEVEDYLNAGWRAGRVMRYEHVRDYLLEIP